jgi:ribonucleotide reductase alpha subunit
MATTSAEKKSKEIKKLRIERKFTSQNENPFDTVEWGIRDAVAGDFRQEGVEAPVCWSDSAVGIVAKLYFATIEGKRENSIKTLISRVVKKITDEGVKHGYFGAIDNEKYNFEDELIYILLHQMAAFNTPVWINLGVPGRKQSCSACYLLNVEDIMFGDDSITDWWVNEAKIFKTGAGSGVNLSKIRGSMEPISVGGIASGPVSFIRPADSAAGTIKSGSVARRAAKLVCLDIDHPDVIDFIESKVREDRRMRALMAAGENLDPSTPEGEKNIAECTSFQNANISVRLSDEFMEAVEADDDWYFTARKSGEKVGDPIPAKDLLRKIAEAAWQCADPGVMFDGTINKWHTTPRLGKIETSNPCLPGDTLVDTSEGRIRIDKLVEDCSVGAELPYVFSWDIGNTLPVLKKIKRAFVTKMADELVEVKTDKGASFKCTPNHRVLVRTSGRGSCEFYGEAKNLFPGVRLRKIARGTNNYRSGRKYINHRETDQSKNGTVNQARWMWEQINGPIDKVMEVHHINEIPSDDRLSNFELKECREHCRDHSSGSNNSNYIDADDWTLFEVYEKAEGNLKRSHRVSYPAWKKAVEQLGLTGKISHGNARGVQGKSWDELYEYVEQNRTVTNDTVKEIRFIKLNESIPVYDLEIEDTHNFAVATEGIDHTIIVHNCCEVHQNNNTSCNLASLNLVKFLKDETFDIDSFNHTVDIIITAMDITCCFSELPTKELEENTRNLRQLGLGYSNLGAALMIHGVPYDSDEAREWTEAVTSLMTGRAYKRSGELAERLGIYKGYSVDMDNILDLHIDAMEEGFNLNSKKWKAAKDNWDWVVENDTGYRNSQVSVIAPTGTISFMMDCDTTGAEPAYALKTFKKLAAGGTMEQNLKCYNIINDKMILRHETFKLPEICQTASGDNPISSSGHLDMIAAIQPHISGAISKTCNLPNTATVDDIYHLYLDAWKKGLKCLSVYRDGSKATQVLSAKDNDSSINHNKQSNIVEYPIADERKWVTETVRIDDYFNTQASRRKLDDERQSLTHKFSIGEHKGYVTAGMYADGTLGEIFLSGIGKDGSTLKGVLEGWAIAISMGLQYGVPLEKFANKFSYMRFEPEGLTSNPEIRVAHSILDYVIRWLVSKFSDEEVKQEFGINTKQAKELKELDKPQNGRVIVEGKVCECGATMLRTGTCYSCPQCGKTTGCM